MLIQIDLFIRPNIQLCAPMAVSEPRFCDTSRCGPSGGWTLKHWRNCHSAKVIVLDTDCIINDITIFELWCYLR